MCKAYAYNFSVYKSVYVFLWLRLRMCVCVCVYFQYFLCIFACSCLLCLEMYIYILVLCLWRVCVRDFVRSYLYLEYLLFLTVHAFICHYIIGSPRGKSQRQAILVDAVFSPYFEIKSADIGCKLGIFTPGVTDTLWGGTFFSYDFRFPSTTFVFSTNLT